MKRVKLDHKKKEIRDFVQSLPLGGQGCILELNGQALARVVRMPRLKVDKGKLKAAILRRRDESRRLNEEWEAVDREMWRKIEDREE